MENLQNKKIIVGISGGIAAYKAPLLIRELVKRGAKVKVAATDNALKFVTLLTLQTLSNNNVYNDMFGSYQSVTTEHISLAQWADCIIVAPATADIIGKYANGIADEALSTLLTAFDKKVFMAPAMNTAMYCNFAVQQNMKTLQSHGVEIIDAQYGELACGQDGKGRMADIEDIVARIENYFSFTQDFAGKTVTVTAGPTREKIDSVRFISNNSSGKMGIAVAGEFVARGAVVNLVLGPVQQKVQAQDRLNVIDVVTAEQMYEKTVECFAHSDIAVCAAAVADYTTDKVFEGKMKKKDSNLTLQLVPTKDILATLGQRKKDSQLLIGFALETDNELGNAKGKLAKKNADLIILNSLKDAGAGFEVDTNKVTFVDKYGNTEPMCLKAKREVARDIVNKIKEFL